MPAGCITALMPSQSAGVTGAGLRDIALLGRPLPSLPVDCPKGVAAVLRPLRANAGKTDDSTMVVPETRVSARKFVFATVAGFNFNEALTFGMDFTSTSGWPNLLSSGSKK